MIERKWAPPMTTSGSTMQKLKFAQQWSHGCQLVLLALHKIRQLS